MKKVFLGILIFIFGFLFIQSNVYAMESNADDEVESLTSVSYGVDSNSYNETVNDIKEIELTLNQNDSSVLEELNDQLNYYNNLLKSETDDERSKTITNLINSTENLIYEYEMFNNGITSYGSFHLIYSPAVSAVISYFNLRGYKLAAELLTHAKNNDDLDSTYKPINVDQILSSSEYKSILNSSSNFGTTTFTSGDLYYALHSTYYSKSESGNTVVIKDRFDFEKDSIYNGITGLAVGTMHKAQLAGTIVPFISEIVFYDDSIASTNQESYLHINTTATKRLYEEKITLGKREYRDITVKFDTSGTRVIQTCGSVDTVGVVYRSSGSTLASNDDGGYKYNFFISQYFTANVEYVIRVRFFGSNYGETKLVITTSTGAIKPGKNKLDKFSSVYNASSSTFTFNTFATANYSRLITYTPPATDYFSIYTTGNIDTFMYILDPRSTYITDRSRYNDDSGASLNAKIDTELAQGIDYLIIYTTYSSSSTTGSFTLKIHKQ